MNYPCTASEAVERGVAALAMGGEYILGTGNYFPAWHTPFSTGTVHPGVYELGSDCAGFAICWCWKITRHRPHFNQGPWASVVDDVNVNSLMEDGQHHQELAVTGIALPRPGDLLCYPTFTFAGKEFIGHVGLIETVPADYHPGEGWHRLGILQCHGPNGFRPAVVRSDGSIWDHHDHLWDGTANAARRTQVVRVKERT